MNLIFITISLFNYIIMALRLFRNFAVTVYPKSHVVSTLWVEYI
jgi:hypothetical protein